jgi:hypothetical protein
MRTKNEARLKMYQSVADFLSQNTETTKSLPEFADLFAQLQLNISDILNYVKNQSGNKGGVTFAKKKEKDEVMSRTLALAGKLTAYATITGDELLKRTSKLNPSKLQSKSEHHFVGISLSLCDTASALLDKLAGYSVTAGEIDRLRQLCSEFQSMIPKPREARQDYKQINLAIRQLMDDTDIILEKMDALIQIIRYSNAIFYEHYTGSRKVIDIGRRSQAVRGTVKDALSKSGIPGVNISFTSSNGNGEGKKSILEKRTASKGGFIVPTISTGAYQVRAVKEGYQPLTLTVHVSEGELAHVNFELSPQ